MSSAVLEMLRMAKKTGRPKGVRDDVTVKIDRKLASMAKVIAGRRGITAAELISEILQAPLDRLYAQLVRELGAEVGNDNTTQ
jgi:hypothetical protein